MNNSMITSGCRKNLRRQLLTTVSMLALVGFVAGAPGAKASDNDADRPVIWIDLGGQFEQIARGADLPAPPFESSIQTPLHSPVKIDRPPLFGLDEDTSISFRPEQSDWVFSASLRYGRSSGRRDVHDQTKHREHKYIPGRLDRYYTPIDGKMADIEPTHHESHAVIDFQAGKDVGLGLFGGGTSVFNVGVRFAQLTSTASVNIHAKPDVDFYNAVPSGFPASWYVPAERFHAYTFQASSHSGFHAVGPSVSWNASAPLAGNKDSSEIDLDWGLNAALLFGRQRASGRHQTGTKLFHQKYSSYYYLSSRQTGAGHNRQRSVVVPNVGGFAGISFRYADAKISFGYRGDFFFGALDTGTDTAKRTNLGFYGPYASISIGLP